ncbi:MAG TPA: glycosyltransferase [Flavobacterium sp.]|nr:glycosyltransferase [Flavobacterium sp.]
MSESISTVIVIPCYNEEKGIVVQDFLNFIQYNKDVLICFVDDGSKDYTIKILEGIKTKFPNQVHIHSCEVNVGKAEAVRTGINYCIANFQFDSIGYLDADLATTLEEFCEIKDYIKNEITFCFGSRILKLGSTIKRDYSRFLIGRIIATFISNQLQLGVYDTQCGCKVFTKQTAELLFDKKFISRWLFDVELFHRMKKIYGKENALKKMYEVPLKSWIEKGDSKVKFTYFFKLWLDLYYIGREYNKN